MNDDDDEDDEEGETHMLTNFGKALRKIRIEHEKTLGDLGELLNVSAAYLSAIETGKKPVPPTFLNSIREVLHLNENEMAGLTRAAALQAKEVSMGLATRNDRAKELAVAFARRFETMSTEEVEKMFDNLNKL